GSGSFVSFATLLLPRQLAMCCIDGMKPPPKADARYGAYPRGFECRWRRTNCTRKVVLGLRRRVPLLQRNNVSRHGNRQLPLLSAKNQRFACRREGAGRMSTTIQANCPQPAKNWRYCPRALQA